MTKPKQTYDLRYLRERPNGDGSMRRYWIRRGRTVVLPPDRIAAHKECDRLNRAADAGALPAFAPAGITAADVNGPPRTMQDLIDHVTAAANWRALSPKTRANYESYFRDVAEVFGDQRIASVTRPAIKKFLEAYEGQAAARVQAYAAIRKLFYEALDEGLVERNPAAKLKVAKPAPRVVVWDRHEDAAFVALADAMGLAYLGDATVIAAETGQRREDVLKLTWGQWDGAKGLLNFRRTNKTKAVVAVRATPRLAARLSSMSDRRRAGLIATIDPQAPMIVRPGGHARPNGDAFAHEFARLRAELAQQDGMAGVDAKHFRDLRDTAVVRLAEAGCTIPEICAITGHTLAEAHNILKHYFSATQGMADNAIAKLIKSEEGWR